MFKFASHPMLQLDLAVVRFHGHATECDAWKMKQGIAHVDLSCKCIRTYYDGPQHTKNGCLVV